MIIVSLLKYRVCPIIPLGAPPPLKILQNSPGPVRAPRHETISFYYKISTLPKGWQKNTSIYTNINTRGGSPLGP